MHVFNALLRLLGHSCSRPSAVFASTPQGPGPQAMRFVPHTSICWDPTRPSCGCGLMRTRSSVRCDTLRDTEIVIDESRRGALSFSSLSCYRVFCLGMRSSQGIMRQCWKPFLVLYHCGPLSASFRFASLLLCSLIPFSQNFLGRHYGFSS